MSKYIWQHISFGNEVGVTVLGKMCILNRDSNLGPLTYRADALPIELFRPPRLRTTTFLPFNCGTFPYY